MNAPRRFAEYDPTTCLNCGADLDADDRHCRDCGQRNRTQARSIFAWIAEGLSSLFHLEGKLVNTLRDLPKPGRYAYNYLNGQRERYVHPLRLLLFSSLVCFAAMSGLGWMDSIANPDDPGEQDDTVAADFAAGVRDGSSDSGAESDRHARDVATAADDFDQTVTDLASQLEDAGTAYTPPVQRRMRQIDLLRAHIYAHDRANALVDSLAAGGLLTTSHARLLADTLLGTFPLPANSDALGEDVFFFDEVFVADARTLAEGTPEQVVAASELQRPISRLAARKFISLYQQGTESFVSYLAANVSWAVLLFVPLIAFGYFLAYFRRMPYYAQHLAYAAILLSVTLLLIALGTGLTAAGLGAGTWTVLGLGLVAYVVAGEAYLYGVPWWKAALKGLAISFYGTFAFTVATLLWLGIAVALA